MLLFVSRMLVVFVSMVLMCYECLTPVFHYCAVLGCVCVCEFCLVVACVLLMYDCFVSRWFPLAVYFFVKFHCAIVAFVVT